MEAYRFGADSLYKIVTNFRTSLKTFYDGFFIEHHLYPDTFACDVFLLVHISVYRKKRQYRAQPTNSAVFQPRLLGFLI